VNFIRINITNRRILLLTRKRLTKEVHEGYIEVFIRTLTTVAIMQWLVDIREPSYRWLWVWLHYCTNQFRPIHLIYDNSWTVTIDGCHVLSMNYSPFRSNRLYPRVLTGSVFLIFKFIMCLFTLISVCLCLFYLLFFGHTSLFL
jgi:hypothetical protein